MSDTHGRHGSFEVPAGDLFLFAGDLCGSGTLVEVESFASFIAGLDFRHKVVIAGNHDFAFEGDERRRAEALVRDAGAIYLNDAGCEIDGIRIWGSPIQPWFYDWAFNRRRGADIRRHWDRIPGDTDILVTHGPPHGILDATEDSGPQGCEDLLEVVLAIKPRLHVFGHIHEGYGRAVADGIPFVNASNLDLRYEPVNPPVAIEWDGIAKGGCRRRESGA